FQKLHKTKKTSIPNTSQLPVARNTYIQTKKTNSYKTHKNTYFHQQFHKKYTNPRKNHRIHHRNHKNTIEYHRIHIEIIQTLKLGRVSIHKVWDAYPYTQLGTRIHARSWDAYTRVHVCARACTLVTYLNK